MDASFSMMGSGGGGELPGGGTGMPDGGGGFGGGGGFSGGAGASVEGAGGSFGVVVNFSKVVSLAMYNGVRAPAGGSICAVR